MFSSSGLAYGGNKIRKLENNNPDKKHPGANALVSIGEENESDPHPPGGCRRPHLGLKARLVQEKWVPWDDPTNDRVGNILLSRMMGADSRFHDAGFDIGVRDS